MARDKKQSKAKMERHSFKGHLGVMFEIAIASSQGHSSQGPEAQSPEVSNFFASRRALDLYIHANPKYPSNSLTHRRA